MSGGMIRRWRMLLQEIAGPEEWPANQDEVPPYFFSYFRPSGARLDDVFRGLPHGDEFLRRLRGIFAAAAETGEGDMYFIVRQPKPATLQRLLSIADRTVESLSQILKVVELGGHPPDPFYDPIRERRLRFKVVEGSAPARVNGRDSSLEDGIYDLRRALVEGVEPEESDAKLLLEPLYRLACDYNLAYYVLWPLYQKATELSDPFEPLFELWSLGAELRADSADDCRIYVPRLLP